MGGVDKPDDGAGKEVNVKVNIRTWKYKNNISVLVNLNSTVRDFKSIVAHTCAIPARLLRFKYKRRLLKDDETLKSKGIEANHNVLLISVATNIYSRCKKRRQLLEYAHDGLPFDSKDNMSSYMGSVPSDDYFAAQDGSENTNPPTPNTDGTQTKSCETKIPDLESMSDFPSLQMSYRSAALASLYPRPSHPEPEEVYARQLAQLREMGFLDTQENIKALMESSGSVPGAVDRLLG